MAVTQEDYARPFLNSPELIRQSLTVSTANQNKPTKSDLIFIRIFEWFFPEKHDSPLPQKTYHNRHMPS